MYVNKPGSNSTYPQLKTPLKFKGVFLSASYIGRHSTYFKGGIIKKTPQPMPWGYSVATDSDIRSP